MARPSGSSRRLFVPRKSLLSPVYQPDLERPHAILRTLASIG
jgi:hypothetical protein